MKLRSVPTGLHCQVEGLKLRGLEQLRLKKKKSNRFFKKNFYWSALRCTENSVQYDRVPLLALAPHQFLLVLI